MNNYLNKNMIFKALSVAASISVIFSGCGSNISQDVNSTVHLSSNIEETVKNSTSNTSAPNTNITSSLDTLTTDTDSSVGETTDSSIPNEDTLTADIDSSFEETTNSPTPDLDTSTSNIESPIDNPDIITYCAKENNSENKIFFNYPQFSETKDNYEEINSLIVDFVKLDLQSRIGVEFNGNIKDSPEDLYWGNNEYSLWGVNVDYTITRNDSEYLSIIFEGSSYYKDAPHPNNNFSALVIDVQNCKVAALSDICKVDTDFVNLIKNKYKEQIRAGLAEKFEVPEDDISTDTENNFLNYGNLSLQEILRYGDLESNFAYSYFLTDTGLGISIRLTHALGDHFEVMIKYDELN